MRWNCPHCSVALAVPSDKLTNSWSFARCYSCGGFALVRKSQADQASGEDTGTDLNMNTNPSLGMAANISLATDAHTNAAHATHTDAAADTNAATDMSMDTGAPEILPGTMDTDLKPMHRFPKRFAPRMDVRAVKQGPSTATLAQADEPAAQFGSEGDLARPSGFSPMLENAKPEIPDPLQDLEESYTPEPTSAFWKISLTPHRLRNLMNLGIALALASAVGSGVYLYHQGRALWEKAGTELSRNGSRIERSLEKSLSKLPEQNASTTAQSGSSLASSRAAAVPSNAMPAASNSKGAPQRPGLALGNPNADQRPIPAHANADQRPTLAHAGSKPISDQVHHQAMAPNRSPAVERPALLMIKSKVPNGSLRAGPGTEFKLVGIADPVRNYLVVDWKDRWFKIILDDPKNTAWIRNDLVELATDDFQP